MRNLIIRGIATVVIVAGATVLFNGNHSSKFPDDLLKEYQDFSDDLKNPKTASNLMASCKNPQSFNKEIQDLERKLAILQQRKNDILYPEEQEKEYIPSLGEQAPDLGDPGPIETEQEEYIPRLGEHPLDFDGNTLPIEEKEYIPRLGEQAPDLGDPGPIGTEQEEYIPRPGDQPLNFIEDANTFSNINILEEEIKKQIANMKLLCNEEENQENKEEKKIISKSCEDACKKYSECTHYTEDTTQQDRQDAYDSCMIECATWSDETKICINKQAIKNPGDCTNLSMCALSEY